jgi:hypothetical protein
MRTFNTVSRAGCDGTGAENVRVRSEFPGAGIANSRSKCGDSTDDEIEIVHWEHGYCCRTKTVTAEYRNEMEKKCGATLVKGPKVDNIGKVLVRQLSRMIFY